MRRLTATLATVVVTACASVPTGPSSTTSSVTSTVPSSTTTSSTSPSTSNPGTTTTASLGDPVALIAPSGVPVVITGIDGTSFSVLTPCGETATLRDGSPIHDVDVVIDPGHGGPIDTGAVAPTGLAEKDLNLDVSFAVSELLTARGLSVLLTRTGDYPIPIVVRAEYADRVGARALVSIHHNAPVAPASDIPGIEIFVQSESSESRRLGGLLYESTMEALGRFDVDWDRAPDAGVMTVINPEGLDAYGMIRRPETVSALIELGYLANRAEAELYQRPEYVPTAARAVADAVLAFLQTNQPGSGFVEGRVFRPGRGVGRDQCIEPDLELSLYPNVIGVEVGGQGSDTYSFDVTISSGYDSAERYADGIRIIGDDGRVYADLELIHDHAAEQPFTRSLSDVVIPPEIRRVTVEARDLRYGWGGETVSVELP